MLKLKIWIDADSCPAILRDFLIETAKAKSFVVALVANHEIIEKSSNVEMIVCKKEKDSADNFIFENTQNNDIVITRDILFAERLVKKGISVLNDRGTIFTKSNIEDRLMERNLNMNLVEIGIGGKKKTTYSQNELKKFKSAFDIELQKHIIAETYKI